MKNKLKLEDALHTGVSFSIELGKQLGAGAQGQVFLISQLDAVPGPHILKIYEADESSFDAQHLFNLVQYIDDRPELRLQPGFSLPRFAVKVPGSGRIGCLAPMLSGLPLYQSTYKNLLKTYGLQQRLEIARQMAEDINVLHKHQIILADMNDSNSVFDPHTHRVKFYDIDGCGVLTSARGDRFVPGLEPLVKGKFEDFLAPELWGKSSKAPSLASDRWALAVFIHKTLLGGLPPFNGLPYLKIIKEQVRWPHFQTGVPPDAWTKFHQAELPCLGRTLRYRFNSVFNRGLDESWHLVQRPKAEEWIRDLLVASNWTQKCKFCGIEFVSEGLLTCPACESTGFHFSVRTFRQSIPIWQEGQNLHARDVGFTDVEGRYPLVSFHGNTNGLEMIARVTLQDKVTRLRISSQESIRIDRNSRDRLFTVYSSDGKTMASFYICVPCPRLNTMIPVRRKVGVGLGNPVVVV